MDRLVRASWPALIGLLLLAGCSSSPSEGPRGATGPVGETGVRGLYKVGKPYSVKGVWYYPQVDYDYRETGIASWYGPGFHGEATANGEPYDMNGLTAAHKTLPMPSIVRVTNIANGRTLKLRVNDRGPFVDGRIIDVSRRAAQLLGFYAQGTVPVEVQIEADESRMLAEMLTGGSTAEVQNVARVEPPQFPASSVALAEAPPNTTAPMADADVAPAQAPMPAPQSLMPVEPSPVAQAEPVDQHRIDRPAANAEADIGRAYVQAGAFADVGNARKARDRLARLGEVEISSLNIAGRDLHRVRLGPYATGAQALQALNAAVGAGYAGSLLVFE